MLEKFSVWSEFLQAIHFILVTVVGGVIAVLWKVWGRFFSSSARTGANSLSEVVARNFPDERNCASQVVRVLTCVIVDDKPEDFPVDFMRGFFGKVEVRSSVSLAEARVLAEYDFIFLDVAGVVVEDAEFGGATLIDDIQREGRRNTIVSVSSKKYDLRVTNYFATADIRMRKPLRVDDIRQQVLSHIEQKIGPHALARKIDSEYSRLYGVRKLKALARSFANSSSVHCSQDLGRAMVNSEFEALSDILSRMRS